METSSQETIASISPMISMFETFRVELDEHHDRRERIVKASRDITAASKKIIFALQRVRTVNAPLQSLIAKALQPHIAIINERFNTVVSDVQSVNFYRYQRQITGGIQEWMEAQIFQHYLEKQQLLSFNQASEKLQAVTATATEGASQQCITLTPEDYILGIFDATGELMRFAITNMATSGALPITSSDDGGLESQQHSRTVLQDLQTLRTLMFTLTVKSDFDFHMNKDTNGKLSVMLESVEKVEKSLYGLIVRGSERPKGWMPDVSESRGTMEAEA